MQRIPSQINSMEQGTWAMTPGEQIDALIAAGEKATQGEWGVGPFALSVQAEYEAEGQKWDMKVFDIRGWGHLTGKGHARGLDENAARAIQEANGSFAVISANSRSAIKAMRDRNATLEAENARLKEIEEDHQEHIQFWANAAGDEAVYKASWIRAYKKLEAENAALQARVDGARTLIQCLHENDPNSDAADAVTVLDVWRKDAPAWLAQDEQKGKL